MKLKATDIFHTSETRTVKLGEEFEVADALGKDLVDRGLATPVGGETEGQKAEAELLNKMEPAPENKRKSRPRQRIVSETGAETNAEQEAEQEALLSRLTNEE